MPGLRERVGVLDEEQVHHQADDFARREVLAGRLVRLLGEPPDQLLEDEPITWFGHRVGVQIDVGERRRPPGRAGSTRRAWRSARRTRTAR